MLVLDDFDQDNPLNMRKIKSIRKAFPGCRFILLCKTDVAKPSFLGTAKDELSEFRILFLWSLTRAQVRTLAEQYVEVSGSRTDTNDLVLRSVENLEKLNLHRTPLNIITLFRIADSAVDISPVNRTDMCERFLFLLFTDFAQLPRYGTNPDQKDSIYALGFFCEFLMRRENIIFSKNEFFTQVGDYCRDRMLSIEVDLLFRFLVEESLLVARGDMYCFRFLHWIYFFAAHRMYHSPEFADYILAERNYARFPEVIEFYSGIDRRRVDLLVHLKNDLECLLADFTDRFEIGLSFDPYRDMMWKPGHESLEAVRKEIAEEAAGSGLPMAIKDRIADKGFDWSKPYSQELSSFISDSSLGECMRVCVAASNALRNSDHAEAGAKTDLFTKVVEVWTRLVQVGVMIAPILARDDRVDVEGVQFVLMHDEEQERRVVTEKEKLFNILLALPESVFRAYEKEISSRRMSPLFSASVAERGDSELWKLLCVLLLISSRSTDWRQAVENYILSQPKNSMYLLVVFETLLRRLKHGIHTRDDKKAMLDLVGVALARHETGSSKPSKKLIEKNTKRVFKEEIPV